MQMDLSSFKLDIDELLNDFTREKYSTLTDMKRVWCAKKFSYIYEASPKSSVTFFMQALFSHSIGHMTSSASLSQRLGGLYCLYCLYETQPYKPRVKIYLCLGELKKLKLLVVDAKKSGIKVVPALVKRMLSEKMFLFGSTDSCSIAQRVDAFAKLQDKNLQIAYEKLMSNTEIEDYVNMNIGDELGFELFKKMSTEYTNAKEKAIKEATHASVDMEDIKHIAENRGLESVDVVEELLKEWDSQKDSFYRQTDIVSNGRETVLFNDDDADGFAEVERLFDV